MSSFSYQKFAFFCSPFADNAYYISCNNFFCIGKSVIRGYTSQKRSAQEIICPFNVDSILDVSSGKYHSIALLKNGTCFSSGKNSRGQCCNGTFDDPKGFEVIKKIKNVKRILCGFDSSFFLTRENELFACGDNSRLKLGITKRVNDYVKVPTLSNTNVEDFAVSIFFCSVLKRDGNIYVSGVFSKFFNKRHWRRLVFKPTGVKKLIASSGFVPFMFGITKEKKISFVVSKNKSKMYSIPYVFNEFKKGSCKYTKEKIVDISIGYTFGSVLFNGGRGFVFKIGDEFFENIINDNVMMLKCGKRSVFYVSGEGSLWCRGEIINEIDRNDNKFVLIAKNISTISQLSNMKKRLLDNLQLNNYLDCVVLHYTLQ